MATFAIQMTGGTVAIMQTVGKASIDECLAKWPPEEQAKVVSFAPIDPATIPEDRSFRNAWTLNIDKIEHDMDKARDIVRDRLRAERQPVLDQLDMAYLRADETKDDAAKTQVATLKQKLRDAPAAPEIDAATTVDDLKAITLESVTDKALAKAVR